MSSSIALTVFPILSPTFSRYFLELLSKEVLEAKDFAKNLSNDVTKNITLWDERLSSQGAFNLSSELAINSSKKVKKLDENSAQFILQGVLDFYHKKNT